MKAWVYDGVTGGMEKNLKINDAAAQPTLGDDEILVEVHAMALNPVDYKVTESARLTALGLKCIPGADFCGKVTKTGSKVDSIRIGEWVFGAKVGAVSNGTLCQYVSVAQNMLTSLPEGVEVDDAATVGIVGLTEMQAIKPHVKPGDKIFINGGSGGTGVYGIQIAKALGCHVTTTCSTGNSHSMPSRSTLATVGRSAFSARMASVVCRFERVSSHLPSRTSVMTAADASK